MIERFLVSRDDSIYQAWPDLALTPNGTLVCIFTECNSHADRDHTRVMLTTSRDRGRTWSPKRPLTDPLRRKDRGDPSWDCHRIGTLADGRLVAPNADFPAISGDVVVWDARLSGSKTGRDIYAYRLPARPTRE